MHSSSFHSPRIPRLRTSGVPQSSVTPGFAEPARGASVDSPRDRVSELEASPRLPSGTNERFAGYGVMGLPFRSGHLLAMRRFPASSIGPAYRSVWHRDPRGRWTFFQDVAPNVACTRYFGAAVDEIVNARIDIAWSGPSELSITVVGDGHRLDWRMCLTTSKATRLMNALGSVLPEPWWRSERFLAAMSRLIPPILHTGKLRLAGVAPNGQRFIVNPSLTWLIADAEATLDQADLGDPGSAPVQGSLGDFRIPQRGLFAIGRAFFEPGVAAVPMRS
jgi:hypothetical protein